MGTGRTAGKKTGPKPSFTRDDVIDAALDAGIADFTLAEVATKIGVVTSAVYRRFDSRDDLLDACLSRVASAVALPRPGMSWQEICRLWADECWRICGVFPGLVQVVYSYPAAFTRIGSVAAAYADALAAHGRTVGQAGFALDFIGDTVFSCRLGVEAMRSVDESGESGLERAKERTDASHPIQPEDSWADRGFVDLKVDFIIDGLERNWPAL
ncbi:MULTISPECIES: TetR/AcrR family transcriptional regulator [Corynebacterium]|jgi:AcrR family transcriptional regulator|uniref:HTH tetR-type domain-containing protein n=1 Tax=Corynebacterium provencense TaxID=1737425 RepID=A0A2Z3YU11_9CORY|nr:MULTISPECIES: TetR/AcrR family transcriptional regulator [Corynebacterium]AWT25537.1 hypothetical protein Csp1_07280 [Corynebacterium provencense]MCI1256433.1 TetR/AcrR family transcriptional regulator [Corynebacterium provencense]